MTLPYEPPQLPAFTGKQVHTLSNGSEALDWLERNCYRCAWGNVDTPWDEMDHPCPLQQAFDCEQYADEAVANIVFGGSRIYHDDCQKFADAEQRAAAIEREQRAEYAKHQHDMFGGTSATV